MAARMFNLYQDTTKKDPPTAELKYSTTTSTTGSVTVELVNPSTEITVTNNSGKTSYIFTQNGTFTFEFVDKNGAIGSTTATVNWIVDNSSQNLTGTSTINTTSKESEKSKENNNHKVLASKRAEVELPEVMPDKNITLTQKEVSLSNQLKEKLPKNSECFDLYFESKNEKSRKIGSSLMRVSIKVNPNKKLKAVYLLDQEDNLIPLNYKVIGKGKIQVEVSELGKYVLTYEDDDLEEIKEENSKKTTDSVQKMKKQNTTKEIEDKKSKFAPWIIGGSLILIFILSFLLYKLAKKSK